MIRWKQRSMHEDGEVAGVCLFTITEATLTVKAADPWVLRCTLPGVDRPTQHPDPAAARAYANIVLSRWLSALAEDDPTAMAELR